jgi:hypothetical protein
MSLPLSLTVSVSLCLPFSRALSISFSRATSLAKFIFIFYQTCYSLSRFNGHVMITSHPAITTFLLARATIREKAGRSGVIYVDARFEARQINLNQKIGVKVLQPQNGSRSVPATHVAIA